MGSRKANVMVVGKTGSGKTTALSLVTQFFLAKSDVSQLKELYSGDEGETKVRNDDVCFFITSA